VPRHDESQGPARAVAQDAAQRISHELHEMIRALVGGITLLRQPFAATSALRESERHLECLTATSAAPTRFSWTADDATQISHRLREHAALLERCVVLAARCAEAEADAAALAGEHDSGFRSDLGRYAEMARALRAAEPA